MATYDALASLPLRVEGYDLKPLTRPTPHWTRRTTEIHLHGAGETGRGEDVTYGEEEQFAQIDAGPALALAGDWTLETFSRRLDTLDAFFGAEPAQPAYRHYRRWAFESAALDLALRQAGRSLHAVLGREPQPLRFVVSLRLGEPPSFAPLERRPGARFKLDADPAWDDAFIERVAADGRCDVIDFKGAYKGTVVDVETDPDLYRRVAEALPDVLLEDPDLTVPAARDALAPHRDRITWDAPFHAVGDIEPLEWQPRVLNVKPSRFGTLRALFEAFDWCEARGIALYGGGQSELGVGRGQIQLLASLFHPGGPNDVAPRGWDWDEPPGGLEPSPLDPRPAPVGFARAD